MYDSQRFTPRLRPARPPQHVLRTIRDWAINKDLISGVYGVGSRFNFPPSDSQSVEETEDLDLLILPVDSALRLSALLVAEWRATLSILTAFQVDLHVVGSGAGFTIFQRTPMITGTHKITGGPPWRHPYCCGNNGGIRSGSGRGGPTLDPRKADPAASSQGGI